MRFDSNQLLSWMRWIAQDKDGAWWAYEHEPHMADYGWYENEVGRSVKISKENENLQWKKTLRANK